MAKRSKKAASPAQPKMPLKAPPDISARLRLLRDAWGFTSQEKFADEFQANRSQYSNWERPGYWPNIAAMIRLCEWTGVTLDWIYRDIRSGVTEAAWTRIKAVLAAEPGGAVAEAPPALPALPVRASRPAPAAKQTT